MGNDPFVDAAESASFPLPGTGKRQGGEKTQPLHHFPSHLGRPETADTATSPTTKAKCTSAESSSVVGDLFASGGVGDHYYSPPPPPRAPAPAVAAAPSAPSALVSEVDMATHRDKTNFYLRIAEIVRENSVSSSLVVMTLPLPKRGVPHSLYMAWLDFTTKNMPPFLFVRGNQESVLTFYS